MPALLSAGTVLRSRYKIVEFISQGGMGAIYMAEDLRLEGRACAVKEMWTDVDAGPDDLGQVQVQFHREASILARLDHPNLPKVSDYFAENSRDYLVMDFVPGKDLKQLMEEARSRGEMLPERQVLDWAKQILDALEYLHTQRPPVLHRDIKPANIKLTPSGTIKLVDFGLVKVMVADEDRTVTVLQGRGTAQYTPLEISSVHPVSSNPTSRREPKQRSCTPSPCTPMRDQPTSRHSVRSSSRRSPWAQSSTR